MKDPYPQCLRVSAIAALLFCSPPAAVADPEDATLTSLLDGHAVQEELAATDGAKGSGESPENAPGPRRQQAPQTRPARERVVEEIVVTAQKTEQRLQDVPISMSVLGQDFLSQKGVIDFRKLSRYVPNFTFTAEQFETQIGIRGFLADRLNKGFEQPVGLVIDGIPYGRKEYFNAAFFDVERVEVLRGPQGTLFGKNTSAGLIQQVPARPTGELAGFVDVELGELDRRRFEAAIGGPVVANVVNFRIAGLSDEQDGFLGNTTSEIVPGADDRLGARDRKAFRIQAGLPDLLGMSLNLTYERADMESRGFSWELRPPHTDGIRAFFREIDPKADFDPENFRGSQNRGSVFGRNIERFAADLRYQIRGWDLHALVGRSLLEVREEFDGDAVVADLIAAVSEDDNPQTTFELGASTTFAGLLGLRELFGVSFGGSDLKAGFFYQSRAVRDSRFFVGIDPVANGAATAANNDTPVGDLPPLPGDVLPTDSDQLETTTMFWDQDSDALAGYTQVDWHVLEPATLTYGMRFSHERKSASWERVVDPTAVLLRASNFEEFSAERDRSEFAFTPKLSGTYRFADSTNFYASWSRGFRAGGFNEFATNGNASLEFDSERSTAWEVGTKSDFLGGLARLDLALYRQNVTDFQSLVQLVEVAAAGSVVRNAADVRSQGVEADYSLFPADWLTLRGALALTDTEFLDFEDGPCLGDRENADGDDNPRCDLTGKPLPFTPKWTHVLTTSVNLPVESIPGVGVLAPASWNVRGDFDVEWQDGRFADPSLDPRTRQSSYFKLDAGIGLDDLVGGWSLKLGVENVTNEAFADKIQQIAGLPGNFNQITQPPRVVFGKVRWAF